MSERSSASHLGHAAIYVVLCYLFVSLFSACAKEASREVSSWTILFFQNILCFLLNFPKAMKEGIKTQHPFLHLTRDMSGFISYFLFVVAVSYIPLSNAVLLQNTAPLWVPFVIWIWFKKRVPPYLWFSLVVGFAGIVFVLKPSAHIIDVGSFYGVLSGMCLGVALVAIRHLTHTEPSSRILFYYFLLGTIFSLPGAIQDFSVALRTPVLYFLLAAAIAFYLVQIFINLGFKKGKASTLSPLAYTAVLFSAILDRIFWNKVPDLWAWIGMILIVASGIVSVYLEKKYEGKYV